MKKTTLAEIELRGDRLILIQKFGHMNLSEIEVDVTGVWHFFKEMQEYLKEPAEEISGISLKEQVDNTK